MSKGKVNLEGKSMMASAAAGIKHMFGGKTRDDDIAKEASSREQRRQSSRQSALERKASAIEQKDALLAIPDDCSHSTVSDAPPSDGQCWEDETLEDERTRHSNQYKFFHKVVTMKDIIFHFFLSWFSAFFLALISFHFVTCSGAPAWIWLGVVVTGVLIVLVEYSSFERLDTFSSATRRVGNIFNRKTIPEKDAQGTIPSTMRRLLKTAWVQLVFNMLLSLAEYYDVLGDLLFPAVVSACDQGAEGRLTEIWADSFESIPVAGPRIAGLIKHLGFFGVTLILLFVTVIFGQFLRGLVKLLRIKSRTEHPSLLSLREACDVAGVMALGSMLDKLLQEDAFVNTLAAGIQYEHVGSGENVKSKRETKEERRLHTDVNHRQAELEQASFKRVFFKVFLESLPQMELQSSLLSVTARYQDEHPNKIICASIALGAGSVLKEVASLCKKACASKSYCFRFQAVSLAGMMFCLVCHVAVKVVAIYACTETHVLSIVEGGCMSANH